MAIQRGNGMLPPVLDAAPYIAVMNMRLLTIIACGLRSPVTAANATHVSNSNEIAPRQPVRPGCDSRVIAFR
jgi:hypothetical protein